MFRFSLDLCNVISVFAMLTVEVSTHRLTIYIGSRAWCLTGPTVGLPARVAALWVWFARNSGWWPMGICEGIYPFVSETYRLDRTWVLSQGIRQCPNLSRDPNARRFPSGDIAKDLPISPLVSSRCAPKSDSISWQYRPMLMEPKACRLVERPLHWCRKLSLSVCKPASQICLH